MTAPAPVRRQVRFGTFELDLTAGELRQNGVKVRLQDQPLRLLTALVGCPGEIVSRDELRQHLWSADTFVEFETGLNAAIKKLRHALRDDADSPRFIETVPKHGYRFIAPVELAEPIRERGVPDLIYSYPAKALLSRRIRLAAAVVLVSVTIGLLAFMLKSGITSEREGALHQISSLAVLPLENLSVEKESDFYAEGMTDELVTEVAKISPLRVISRASIMPYEGKRKPLQEIARELKVDAVVEGTVLRSGHHVRITAQLIQVTPERHLWAESYERDERDVLSLQSELAQDIARQIRITLTPRQRARLGAAPRINEHAHEAYLRGRYWWHRRGGENELKGLRYFEQATTLDASYAPAWAGVADSYIVMAHHGVLPARDAMPKAKAAALKALALDDGLAEAHTSLALIETSYDWNYAVAEREFTRAIELNPNYATAHHWYAHYLVINGRFADALNTIRQAHDLDPYSMTINDFWGLALYYSRDYGRAIAQFRAMVDLDPDAASIGYEGLARVYEQQGDYAHALEQRRELLKRSGTAQGADALSRAYAAGGPAAYWRERIKQLRNPAWPLEMAIGYACQGNREAALNELNRAYDEHSAWLNFMAVEPAFDPLRVDPRFQKLLQRIGL